MGGGGGGGRGRGEVGGEGSMGGGDGGEGGDGAAKEHFHSEVGENSYFGEEGGGEVGGGKENLHRDRVAHKNILPIVLHETLASISSLGRVGEGGEFTVKQAETIGSVVYLTYFCVTLTSVSVYSQSYNPSNNQIYINTKIREGGEGEQRRKGVYGSDGGGYVTDGVGLPSILNKRYWERSKLVWELDRRLGRPQIEVVGCCWNWAQVGLE